MHSKKNNMDIAQDIFALVLVVIVLRFFKNSVWGERDEGENIYIGYSRLLPEQTLPVIFDRSFRSMEIRAKNERK